MRPFLICLSPAIVGFILVVTGSVVWDEALIQIAVALFGIGALVSGCWVGAAIIHKSEEPTGMVCLGAVLAFFGVTAGYFAMAMGGCCGLVMATDSI